MRDEIKIAEVSERWKRSLELWKVPEELLAKASKNPYRLTPRKFKPDQSRRQSGTVREIERLIDESSRRPKDLLDVGSGAGGISLLVGSKLESIIAIDQSKEMLDELEVSAAELGLLERVTTLNSSWPASKPFAADIVLSANVLYNVPDISPFISALIDAANQSVVIEVTKNHPLSNVSPIFEHFHNISRPTTPTAHDVIEIVRAYGYEPRTESWVRSTSSHDITDEERLDEYQSRACIEDERRAELKEFLENNRLPSMEVVMISFDK